MGPFPFTMGFFLIIGLGNAFIHSAIQIIIHSKICLVFHIYISMLGAGKKKQECERLYLLHIT